MGSRYARVHLCRHGEVSPDWQGKIYGGLDVPLDPSGLARFEALSLALAEIPFKAIYSSDLSRTRECAQIIAMSKTLELEVDVRLNEIDRGAWGGLTPAGIEEQWPGHMDAYLQDPDSYREHGGESHADLRMRVMPALEAIGQRHVDEEVLVLCHGQVIRVVLAGILEIPGQKSLQLMSGYGGITTIDRFEDSLWVVQAINAPSIRVGQWGGRTWKP